MSYTPTEWESTDVVTATRLNALEQAVGEMNMSYTPNVWQNGDILTADKMNALEQAVASGGGGSSDFTTATVSFVNTSQNGGMIVAPVADDDEDMLFGAIYVEGGTTVTKAVVLYKGTALAYPDIDAPFNIVSVSGDIVDDGGMAIVSGDGTITLEEYFG